jgi:AhpD family alkylhydroperoxidase
MFANCYDPIMPGPRITERRTRPGAWLIAHVAGRATGTEPPAIFLVLGRHNRLFWGWLHFAGRLMLGGRLERKETELIILRVAYLSASEYELSQHRRLARRVGLTDAEVAPILKTPLAVEDWDPRRRAILAAVDALHEDRDLDDATWAELRSHLDERQCIELCQLVGHYEMLATTIRALRIPPDPPRSRPRP